MAEAFNLAAFKYHLLPEKVWMVTHSKSQSRLDAGTGDRVAADSNTNISDQPSLKRAAEQHFDWRCREPSCFLSVFSDWQQARRWAGQRDGIVSIHEVYTGRLPADTYVFDAYRLCGRLGIAHAHSAHELIFLHRIPGRALGRTRSLVDVEEQVCRSTVQLCLPLG